MTSHPRVFVTGSTGKLGTLVVDALLQRTDAANIVAGVRSATGEATDWLRAKGVQLRIADYAEPETLASALEGIDRLLLISSNAVGQRVAQHGNVIQAARQARVELLAYTSLLHANKTPIPLAPEYRSTEGALAASGVPFALLRNGWYTENYGFTLKQAIRQDVYFGSAGDGRVSSASRLDYAEAAAVVLSSSDHAGKVYELAGDNSFTLSELCAAVSEITGHAVTYRNVSEQEVASSLAGLGLPPAMAVNIAACDTAIAQGGLEDRSRTLSRLIGRATTPYRETLREMLSTGV